LHSPAPAKASSSWSLQPLLLALGFLVLIGISASSLWLVEQSAEDADAVAHTLEVQNKVSLILLHLRRAESAQRGYIITSQPDYLREYRESARNTRPAVADAKAATGDNPQQQKAFSQIENLVNLKLTEMERAIQLYDGNDQPAALALIRDGEGRRAMEDIRDIALKMLAEERRLLDMRSASSARTNLWLLAVTLAGSAMILLIGGLSVYLVQRSSRQREDARSALVQMNAGLEDTIAERTSDLREANNEIQRFAYIVSHDLRSPLVNIMGFTTELEALRKDMFERLAALRPEGDADGQAKDETLDKDFDEALGFIKTSIGKMDRLINSILKLSREGRREFRPEFINMVDLLKGISASQAHKASELGADIEIAALPPAFTDRMAMEQIFSNLVDNALKYLQDGKPGRIQVRGRSTPSTVIYEVEDNGRGIAAEDHERIFDLFRRAGPQDRPGEGIGLAHVRALVRRLGGQMSVKSTLASGSTFTVILPRRWQDEQTADERIVA
jgi:signal transduction histidine kinase